MGLVGASWITRMLFEVLRFFYGEARYVAHKSGIAARFERRYTGFFLSGEWA